MNDIPNDLAQPISVIVTGATGLAGADVVQECINDPTIQRVTVLSRRPLAVEDEKLKVIIHNDFLDYSGILPELARHDAVIWCLGVPQAHVGVAEYEKITLDYTIAGATAMASVNPGISFCFLSGEGADSTEKSRVTFARIKGRTENQLQRLRLAHFYAFRPGFIEPEHPRAKPRIGEGFLMFISPLLHLLLPRTIIRSRDLARAMVYVAKHGATTTILGNRVLRTIAEQALSQRQ
jgi:uncharacterized protein YbjT (DUF2867 family)